MNTIPLSNLIPAVYCRKSTESEERQVLSLSAQQEEATKLATQLGILRTRQYQEAKSAKINGQRMAFTQMIKDIQSNKVNAIICWKLDRLARNMVEGGEIIDLLQRGVIRAIITPFKVYYPNENALLMAVEFGAANQYSRDLSQNVKRGLLKRAKMGLPSGIAPIGFLNSRSENGNTPTIIVDPVRLQIVKQMLEFYLHGSYSGGQLYHWARDIAKLTTPSHKKSGNRLINRSWIYVILRNPIYAGFFYVQGERFELAKELPRLITESEHSRILYMLNTKTPAKTQVHHVVFSGFIQSRLGEFIGPDIKFQVICDCKHKFAFLNKTHCPKCHTPIVDLNTPKYLKYIYYRNGVRKKRNESVKYLSENEIQKEFLNFIDANLVFSQNFTEWCLRHFTEYQNEDNKNTLVIQQSQRKRKQELEVKKIRYREMLADGLITNEEYLFDVEAINFELSNLTFNSNSEYLISQISEILTIGELALAAFESDRIDTKRTILSRFGANLIWDEKKLVIQGRKPIQLLIDGLNRIKIKNPKFEPKTTLADKDDSGVFEDIRPDLLGVLDDLRKKLLE